MQGNDKLWPLTLETTAVVQSPQAHDQSQLWYLPFLPYIKQNPTRHKVGLHFSRAPRSVLSAELGQSTPLCDRLVSPMGFANRWAKGGQQKQSTSLALPFCVVWLIEHLARGRLWSLCELGSYSESTNLARLLWKLDIIKLASLSKLKKVLHYQTSNKQKMAISFMQKIQGGKSCNVQFPFHPWE